MKVPAGPRITAEHFGFRNILGQRRQQREDDQTHRTQGFFQHSFSPDELLKAWKPEREADRGIQILHLE